MQFENAPDDDDVATGEMVKTFKHLQQAFAGVSSEIV